VALSKIGTHYDSRSGFPYHNLSKHIECVLPIRLMGKHREGMWIELDKTLFNWQSAVLCEINHCSMTRHWFPELNPHTFPVLPHQTDREYTLDVFWQIMIRKAWPWIIMRADFGECHVPCPSKTIFVIFEVIEQWFISHNTALCQLNSVLSHLFKCSYNSDWPHLPHTVIQFVWLVSYLISLCP
jgi:hypothetical protein